MPYDNPENRNIKREYDLINKKYIAHTDMLGTANTINYPHPEVEPRGPSLFGSGHGRVIGGGMGCADWHGSSARKHYGDDKSEHEMTGGAILGLQDGTLCGDMSKPKFSRTHYKEAKKLETPVRFGELGNALPSDIGLSSQGMPSANYKRGYAQKDQSPLETQSLGVAQKDGLIGNGMSGGIQNAPGAIKRANYHPPSFMKRNADGTDSPMQMYVPPKKHDFWDDFADGFTDAFTGILDVAAPVLNMVPGLGSVGKVASTVSGVAKGIAGRGKVMKACHHKHKNKCKCPKLQGGNGFAAGTHMDTGFGVTDGATSSNTKPSKLQPHDPINRPLRGGAILGLVKGNSTLDNTNVRPAYAVNKKTVQSTSKKMLDHPVVKSEMPSSTLSGLGKHKDVNPKRPNARAAIVRKVMAEKGLKLIEASKYVKEHGLY
jgi:hypothetical protein